MILISYKNAPAQPRVKRVVKADMVCHLWANQTQDEAYTATRNCSFRGTKLFSYGTVIGQLIERKGKKPLAILNCSSYSSTTNGHQCSMRRAAKHLDALELTDDIYLARGVYDLTSISRDSFERGYKKLLSEIAIGRNGSNRQNSRIRRLESLIKTAAEYSKIFKLGWKPFNAVDSVSKQLADYKKQHAESLKLAKERKEQKEREQREIAEKCIPLWLEGKKMSEISKILTGNDVDYRVYTALRAQTLLRVKPGNPLEVETTLGAEFPVEHARKAWKFIKSILGSGAAWETNGKTIPMGSFKIERITVDGSIIAGCHTVPKAEVLRFAASIGLPV
jgi:hypothetical protein